MDITLSHGPRLAVTQNRQLRDLTEEDFEVRQAAMGAGGAKRGEGRAGGEPGGERRASDGEFGSGASPWSGRGVGEARQSAAMRLRPTSHAGEGSVEVDRRV